MLLQREPMFKRVNSAEQIQTTAPSVIRSPVLHVFGTYYVLGVSGKPDLTST